jgi:16S rRNA (adenine1518-N6/adenine1519-N6)-dimethyltransferase
VQREIAQRAGALPGDKNYSAVSVFIQSLADVRVLEKDISPRNFFPAPEVTSVILRLARSGYSLSFNRELFRRMVKASFSNRRKSLANNLCTMKGFSNKETVREVVSEHFHDANIRAERVSVEGFVRLARAIEKLAAG